MPDQSYDESSFGELSPEAASKKSSNLPLILGGVALAAGIGFFLYKQSAQKTAAPAKPAAPAAPAGPAPGSTTIGTVSTPATATVFKDYPAANKVALWKILSMFPLTSTDGTYYGVGQTPVAGSELSGASFIANKDQASPGSVYVLLNPDDASFLFVDQGTAASQAGGPNAPWSLFLKPGDWKTVSAQAAADAANTQINPAQLPPGLSAATIQGYMSSVAGA